MATEKITCLILSIIVQISGTSALGSYLLLGDTAENTVYEDVDQQATVYQSGTTQIADVYDDIGNVNTYQSSTANFWGGRTGQISAYHSSTINIYDGSIGDIFSTDSSIANLYGGQVDYLISFEDSEIHVYGYDLEIINYSETISGPVSNNPADGLLTGFWANGTAFGIELGNYFGSDPIPANPVTYEHLVLHEIPEPCTFLLFGFGGLVLRIRGRRREIVF